MDRFNVEYQVFWFKPQDIVIQTTMYAKSPTALGQAMWCFKTENWHQGKLIAVLKLPLERASRLLAVMKFGILAIQS